MSRAARSASSSSTAWRAGRRPCRHRCGSCCCSALRHLREKEYGRARPAGVSFASLMNSLQLFLPCAAGVEGFLADEAHGITGLAGHDLLTGRGGVLLNASWHDALRLNLHSRLAQRVLVQLAQRPYRGEDDLYALAADVAWEIWFTPRQSFKVEVTAQHSPLKSL